MQIQEFNEGDWVICQGDVGDYFYVVEEGEVTFHVRGESPDGNLNFPSHQVGTGSICAVTPLKLFRIDQFTFRSLLMSQKFQN